jgi:glucosamine-phosphate N-acetyltransferase
MAEASDADFLYRRLEPSDYDLGFLESLAFLTKIGEVTKEDFLVQYSEMFPDKQDVYKILVIFDKAKGRVIGSGSLIIEKKFIRQLGTAGHIEDIVVSEGYRGRNLGKSMIELLKKLAEVNNCYKVILDCGQHNVGFYEKVRLSPR